MEFDDLSDWTSYNFDNTIEFRSIDKRFRSVLNRWQLVWMAEIIHEPFLVGKKEFLENMTEKNR